MNAGDLVLLSPLLILSGTAVVVMLVAAFWRSHGLAAALTFAGLATALVSTALVWPDAPRPIAPLLVVDRYALFYTGLILAAALAVVPLSHSYLADRENTRREEYYLLLLLATAGAVVLASSVHFASFFLGLELLSVSLYALIAYSRASPAGIEAGVKYLILAGASSAFLLFGMALVYAETGALAFSRLAEASAGGQAFGIGALAGVCLIVVGIGFKLSLVPFHGWAPDVYQGAPAPVTAFVATVSKGAVFAVLLRFFTAMDVHKHEALVAVFATIAVVSMFAGNWLALRQDNVKRLLAYSSIAHMGYLLVAFLASGPWAARAVAFYLTAYFVTTLGAFGVVSILSSRSREAESIKDYRGLAWRRPWEAGVFALMLLSLAGIPLTAGFVGKFFVLAAGVKSSLWALVAILVVNSVIGLFYYLRLMTAMFRAADGVPVAETVPRPVVASVALAVLAAALLCLGLYPAPALRLIQAIAGE